MEAHRSIEEMTERHERKRGRRPGMTEEERLERNAELVRDKVRGQGWEYLAEKYSLQPTQVRRIYNEWRKENQSAFVGRDPIQIVHSMLDRLESWTEQLAEVADGTEAETIKISAIREQLNVLTRTAELMQATGILPHELGTLRMELDVQTLAVKLVTVLTEQGAPPEMKRAILETLRADGVSEPALPVGTG